MVSTEYAYETILVEKPEPRVGLLWLNRPEKRNSIPPELSREMNQVLDQIAEDDEIRVLVISGKGNTFCGGMDLKVFYEYRDRPGKEWSPEGQGFGDWAQKLRTLDKPTIAAVNGHAYGGGFMLISMCAMAIASEEAQIGLSEINWGGPPGGGATRSAIEWLLPKAANYLLFSGKPIDGRQMERIGFVNQTVPHDRLMEETMEFARLTATHSSVALKWLKRQILGSRKIHDYEVAIEYESMISGRMRSYDGYTGNQDGWKGFIDKEYRPGLETKDYAE